MFPTARRALLQSSRRYSSTTTTTAPPKIIFSGIQPTGVPHIGNYLGALRPWVQLQNESPEETKLFYSIVDLHALTVRQDPAQLKQWRLEMLASLLAIGLDPERCTLFIQSEVPKISELMWILSCTASMGYLGRMTQWKSKLSLPTDSSSSLNTLSRQTGEKLKLGLFSYPVLQAADILIHRATHVPVGEDQQQHLEFARELASQFNSAYSTPDKPIFPEPETLISPSARIKSLSSPQKKMSKSDPSPRSRIVLTDDRKTIAKKISAAQTDSIENAITYDPANRPGVANLLEILYHFSKPPPQPRRKGSEVNGLGSEDLGAGHYDMAAGDYDTGTVAEEEEDVKRGCEALAQDCNTLSYKAFKARVSDAVDAGLRDIRERYHHAMNDNDGRAVTQAAAIGSDKARKSAWKTMALVREAVGI